MISSGHVCQCLVNEQTTWLSFTCHRKQLKITDFSLYSPPAPCQLLLVLNIFQHLQKSCYQLQEPVIKELRKIEDNLHSRLRELGDV